METGKDSNETDHSLAAGKSELPSSPVAVVLTENPAYGIVDSSKADTTKNQPPMAEPQYEEVNLMKKTHTVKEVDEVDGVPSKNDEDCGETAGKEKGRVGRGFQGSSASFIVCGVPIHNKTMVRVCRFYTDHKVMYALCALSLFMSAASLIIALT